MTEGLPQCSARRCKLSCSSSKLPFITLSSNKMFNIMPLVLGQCWGSCSIHLLISSAGDRKGLEKYCGIIEALKYRVHALKLT